MKSIRKKGLSVSVIHYCDLLEKSELQEDRAAYEKAKLNDEELIPSDVVYRLLDGENKLTKAAIDNYWE